MVPFPGEAARNQVFEPSASKMYTIAGILNVLRNTFERKTWFLSLETPVGWAVMTGEGANANQGTRIQQRVTAARFPNMQTRWLGAGWGHRLRVWRTSSSSPRRPRTKASGSAVNIGGAAQPGGDDLAPGEPGPDGGSVPGLSGGCRGCHPPSHELGGIRATITAEATSLLRDPGYRPHPSERHVRRVPGQESGSADHRLRHPRHPHAPGDDGTLPCPRLRAARRAGADFARADRCAGKTKSKVQSPKSGVQTSNLRIRNPQSQGWWPDVGTEFEERLHKLFTEADPNWQPTWEYDLGLGT